MTTETRVTPTLPTLKVDEEHRTLYGYGAVFDKLSKDLGGFKETIDKRAFNRTLANEGDILVALNHDYRNSLLGRTSSGTARVFADDIGVRYEVQVPNTRAGDEAIELTKRGDIAGSSFSFSVSKNGETWENRDGERIRTLTEVRLYELGPVVSPAYMDTTVALRSLDDLIAEEKSDSELDEEAGLDTRETTVSAARRMLRILR